MKMLYAFSFLITLFGCAIKSQDGNQPPKGEIVRYLYKYKDASSVPIIYYEVARNENGITTLSVSKSENEITIYKIDDNTLTKIDSLVKEYKVYKIKRSYRTPLDVKDGWSWDIKVEYCYSPALKKSSEPQKNCISSHGYNYPLKRLPRWKQGIYAANDLIESILEGLTDKDIIGKELHYKPKGKD